VSRGPTCSAPTGPDRGSTGGTLYVCAVLTSSLYFLPYLLCNAWVTIAAIFVITLAAIFATAFYLQGR
jgi:hypothetical protein